MLQTLYFLQCTEILLTGNIFNFLILSSLEILFDRTEEALFTVDWIKISASIEWLSLYVNLETRKVTEFESEKKIMMDSFIKENKNNFNNENLKFSSKLRK